MKKISHRKIKTTQIPEIMKSELGIEENVSIAIVEALQINKSGKEKSIHLPSDTDKRLKVNLIDAGKEVGVKTDLDYDASIGEHCEITSAHIEKAGEFAVSINSTRARHSESVGTWNLHINKYK